MNLWVRKIPWSRKWQPTLVFLSGKFHGRRSLVGYSPLRLQRVGHDSAIEHTHANTQIKASRVLGRHGPCLADLLLDT